MFPRQYALPSRRFKLGLALAGPALFATGALAQTPNFPAVPAPQPVAPESLPSVPTPEKAGKARQVPTPAQAPRQPPATSPAITPAQTPENTPPQSLPTSPLDQSTPVQPPAQPAPAYNNPLEAPTQIAPAPTESTPAAPATDAEPPAASSPVEAPAPASTGAPAPQPTYRNPLEQPITVHQASPPQAQPVEIAPPVPVASLPSMPTDYPLPSKEHNDTLGSTYIPVDSWVYPEALRLYSLGYLDSAFISMRPWTRRSLLHILENSGLAIRDSGDEQAQSIYARLKAYLQAETPDGQPSYVMNRGAIYGVETAYTRLMGISGLTLRDSYHLGQTIVNDYGRPYQSGFNNLTGFSSVNEWGRFSLYVRGEYEHAPSAVGYDQALSAYLSALEGIEFVPPNAPQATIPTGPIPSANPFRLQEAAVSFHVLGHEISGGKTDAWLGPGQGGAMAWSNNAEDIYSGRINRVEPLHIPYFSNIFGPIRYDFFVGDLKGHSYPNKPWVHSEMFALRPTSNFEFGFQRTVIWGGRGHVPVNLKTFLRSFFSLSDTQNNPDAKNNANDPGARYSAFNFSWRLPYLRHYVTLYTDSIAHDDVSPISAPRRAAYRPGIYISQFPHLRNLDFRAEAASTDTSTLRSLNGNFNYYEGVQRQGYTNKGFIMGDWIGREAKGGQAWLTYHLSGNEWVQLEYLNKKTPKDFIPDGTTQNQFKVEVVKRLRPNLELDAWYQYEHWIAPIYKTDHQTDNTVSFQFTFYPKLRSKPKSLNGK